MEALLKYTCVLSRRLGLILLPGFLSGGYIGLLSEDRDILFRQAALYLSCIFVEYILLLNT
jgi:hypothetical protein